MKLLNIFIVACVVLAAAQAVATALVILAVVYGLFAYPRQTLSVFALLILAALAEQQPYLLLGLIALAMATAWIFGKKLPHPVDEP